MNSKREQWFYKIVDTYILIYLSEKKSLVLILLTMRVLPARNIPFGFCHVNWIQNVHIKAIKVNLCEILQKREETYFLSLETEFMHKFWKGIQRL